MSDLVQYKTDHGEVTLSKDLIKRYICAGATDQEIELFLNLCKYQALNPWLREAYLVKYGNAPATMIVGWHVFLRRAQKNPQFDGYEVEVYDQNDEIYKGRDKQLISHATAKVYRKDRKHPTVVTALFKEYSTGKGPWAPDKIPATMIRKVALEQALRECYPSDFQGLYGAEEMRLNPDELPSEPIKVQATEVHQNGAQQVTEPEPPDDEIVEEAEVVEQEQIKSPPPPNPFRVVTLMASVHGTKWTLADAAKTYFGVGGLRTTKDFQLFAKNNPDAWIAGCTKLVEAARKAKK